MTYAQFLLAILLPLVAATSALAYRACRAARVAGRALPRSVTVLALALPPVALIYTTPWDSWLIRNAVWGYPPGSIIGTVFGVPLEEYTFMIGTTVLTGAWTLAAAARRTAGRAECAESTRLRILTGGLWLAAGVAGAVGATMERHALYGGSQLAWFSLPLALQAFCGADALRASRRLRLTGLSVTPVLWAADAVGIHSGAWHIGAETTVGVNLAGVLPLEEATFFLLVNLLVVNSVALCLDPLMMRRLRRFSARVTRRRPVAEANGEAARPGTTRAESRSAADSLSHTG